MFSMKTEITGNNYWVDKNILITGAGGFIGKHFIEALSQKGARCVGLYHSVEPILEGDKTSHVPLLIRADLTQANSLNEVIKNQKKPFELIIHSAGLDGNSQYKLSHTAEIMEKNTRMALNVLEAGRDHNISDIVLLSSSEIYDVGLSGSIREEDDYNTRPMPMTNGYVLSKIFNEVLANLFTKQFGINTFLPRLGNVYGPGDYPSKAGRVIPSMMQKLSANQDIDIWGNGKQKRQFMYVTDTVQTVLDMVESRTLGAVNIAGSQPITILELAHKLAEQYGDEQGGRVKLDLSKPFGANDRELETIKMKSFIKFQPTPIEVGLQKTVAWYESANTAA